MDNISLEKFINSHTDFFDVKIIGKSVLGQNIYALNKEFDGNFNWVLVTAGMHAREHLSCDFVVFAMERLIKLKKLNYNISFVPLVNPDGVDFAINGVNKLPIKLQRILIEINGGSDDFSLFKANANGVDLNNNWDADWQNKHTKNFSPASQGFYGHSPMSEPEVQALADWVKKIKPVLTLSYHLKGEEIYFDFFQNESDYKRDLLVAQVFAESTGYKIKPTEKISSGGFKDWCVKELKIPALTIELGEDRFSHPYPISELPQICDKNKELFSCIEKSLNIIKSYSQRHC